MGEAVTGDRASYQYLVESIRASRTRRPFSTWSAAAGFGNAAFRNLSLGVAAIHSAWKI
jgi:demethylmenaquinone methyltransferase/2-methoxy-6-polyprenyl-1,4-benzoquinol methylase